MRRAAVGLCAAVLGWLPAEAQVAAAPGGTAPNPKALVDARTVAAVRQWLDTDVVRLSIAAQNARRTGIDAAGIAALDAQWATELKSADKPLIAATLANPLSAYLTRIQAHSIGLVAEVIVTDANGLNVGQSAITSDYFQGDEPKWQRTFPAGAGALFLDEAEWDADTKTWRAQLNLAVADADGRAIGAATVELNLTELQRRADAR